MKPPRLALALLSGCAALALACAASADPPGRVGRIAYVEGGVAFQPPQEDDWVDAARNFPVTSGEAFWTGDDGRAELEIGAMEAWLDNQTELDVIDLDWGEARFALDQGSMTLRVRRAPRGGVAVSTPAGEVRLDHPGLYRIDVGAGGDNDSYPEVEITTFEGSAGVPGADGLVAVDAGEAALIDPGQEPYAVEAQYAAIDDWARDREARERWSQWDEASPAITGYEDLGRYGQFADDPDYGQVWYPSDTPNDWAPYRFGHWADVEPWGWTWIDDQPWGFAPFHYGRWVEIRGRWAWSPGRPESEPVYAPALVAFFGGGAGGELAWAPLAPDEAYRPSYQASGTYLRRLNAGNVGADVMSRIETGRFGERGLDSYRNAGAAVSVAADAFARGAAVQRAARALPQGSLAPLAGQAALPAPTPRIRFERPNAPAIAAPPARLRELRRTLSAQSAGAFRPPTLQGAAPAPQPRVGPMPTFVAPAQIQHRELQGRTPFQAGSPPTSVEPGAAPLRRLAPPAAGPSPAELDARRQADAAALRARQAQDLQQQRQLQQQQQILQQQRDRQLKLQQDQQQRLQQQQQQQQQQEMLQQQQRDREQKLQQDQQQRMQQQQQLMQQQRDRQLQLQQEQQQRRLRPAQPVNPPPTGVTPPPTDAKPVKSDAIDKARARARQIEQDSQGPQD